MARYITSGDKTTVPSINAEFEKIAVSQEDFLSRVGEAPNQMSSDLDMNSNQIINLPRPLQSTSPVRLKDLEFPTGFGVADFDTLVQAIQSTALEEGDTFSTGGYHAIGDGGAAKYIIKSTATGTYSQLDNIPLVTSGLYASIVPQNNTISVAQAGAKFVDEGVAGFDDRALQEGIDYAIANGVKLIHDGKEAHYYQSHPITAAIHFEGVGEDSILRCHGDFILLDMSDSATFYNNTIIGNFTLQSNGAQSDTAMKIHGLFEGSVVKDVRVVGFRYGMHLTEQFNGNYRNVYVRQAANRHAPLGGNDTTKSYGWWLDGADGQLNAISFVNCGAERNWHNMYIDNSADVGGFVALNWFGGVYQTAWQSSWVIEGGARVNLNGVYHENNYEQAQRVSDGVGILADQGVNFTLKGIVGDDLIQFTQSGGYQQLSANLDNNAPVGNINNLYCDSTVERLAISVSAENIVTNDINVYDWDYYIDGGATQFVPNFEDFLTGKGSDSSVFTNGEFYRDVRWNYAPDDGTGSNFGSVFHNFTTRSGRMFFEVLPKTTATYTTAPSYAIKDYTDATVATVTVPASLTAGTPATIRVTGLEPNQTYRIAQSTTSTGGAGQLLTFQVYEKSLTSTKFITQV